MAGFPYSSEASFSDIGPLNAAELFSAVCLDPELLRETFKGWRAIHQCFNAIIIKLRSTYERTNSRSARTGKEIRYVPPEDQKDCSRKR